VVDGKIYAFGGTVFDGVNLVAQTRTEVMADPEGAGTWDNAGVAELPTATAEGRAYGFDSSSPYELAGKIVIAGGGQWPNETNAVFAYNTATNSYDESIPDLNVSRRDQAGVFEPGNPGRMWVFGGRTGGVDTPPYADPEYYVVNLATFAPVIDINPASLDAELLPDSSLIVPMTVGNVGTDDLFWQLFAGTPGPSWSDNFDSYETGSSMHGQGGWKGWGNDPNATAYVSDAEALSAPNSVAIEGASDLVHEYSGYTTGTWNYIAWQYIPSTSFGESYFILLNQYDDAGLTNNWSTQVNFNIGTGIITNEGLDGGTLPMTKDQWVEIRVEIDLTNDIQTFYYGGDVLFSGSWKDGLSGGGIANIAAVDLFANSAAVVYYDDISLGMIANPACDVDLPWLSFDPSEGTTLPGESTDVNATFDSTGLDVGDYSGNVCATSNDPVNPLVIIPVEMTVLAQADLSITKSAAPDPVRVGTDLTYSLLVTNNGPEDATGVMVVDTLPADVTFVSASDSCTEDGGVVTCDVGDIANGDVVELTIVVAPNVVGTVTNTANVAGNEADPNEENNTASVDTEVIPAIIDLYLPLVRKG